LHTVIVEDQPDGHRLYYVRLLVAESLSRGDTVTLILGESAKATEEFATHLAGIGANVQILFHDDMRLRSVLRAAFRIKADHIVIPDADTDLLWLAFGPRRGARNLTISALVMREETGPSSIPGFQRLRTLIKQLCFRMADRRRNTSMFVLRSTMWAGKSKLPHARDPITLTATSEDIRRVAKEWRLDSDRYWFGVLGKISSRKNIPLLLCAIRKSGLKNVGLLVAGKCDTDVLESLESFIEASTSSAEVVVINRQLTEVELDSAVQTIDCLVAAHTNEGPSGLLGKAAAAKTRIVAAGALSLKSDCEVLTEEAASWCPLDLKSLTAELVKAREKPRPAVGLAVSAEQFAKVLL
jgi:hypothetical protein